MPTPHCNSESEEFKSFAASESLFKAYKKYLSLDDMTMVEFAKIVYPLVREPRIPSSNTDKGGDKVVGAVLDIIDRERSRYKVAVAVAELIKQLTAPEQEGKSK